jgi:predicted N-acetyltransferase YhbS
LGYAANAEIMHSRIQAVLLSAADLLIVSVDSSGTVVGWLQAHAAHIVESSFRVEIAGAIVSPAFRRRGVGRRLVTEAEAWAKTISAEAVVVRSNVKRVESHSFYLLPSVGLQPHQDSGGLPQTIQRRGLTVRVARERTRSRGKEEVD